MQELYKKFKENEFHIIFISVFVIGLFTHGSRIFSTNHVHDDLVINWCGATYTSGRWFLDILYRLEIILMGSHINAKGFIGVITFVCISIITCMIAHTFKIRKKSLLVLLSGILVTYPYVTSLFGYAFTADYYYISIIMVLLAAQLTASDKSKFCNQIGKCILAAILIGLSIAIYQTSLCVYVAYLLLIALYDSIFNKEENWKNFICKCLKYILTCGAGLVFYLFSNKIALRITHFELSNYKGVNNMMSFTAKNLLERIIMGYKVFFFPNSSPYKSSFYAEKTILLVYYLILLITFIMLAVLLIVMLKKKEFRKAIQTLLITLIMPLAFNSAYLTVDVTNTEVTALMLYCNVMIFVLFIILLDNLTYNSIYKKTYIGKIKVIMIVLLSYTIIYNSYLANICYSRTAIQQEQTISYFNRMITRIQMLDGYSTELPVAYINDFNKNMESVLVTQIDYQHAYRIKPYNMTSLINNYKWKDFMQLWNGYRPSEVSSEELQRLKELQEVQNMPCYPDDGSIKIIDGAIVIKFNN